MAQPSQIIVTASHNSPTNRDGVSLSLAPCFPISGNIWLVSPIGFLWAGAAPGEAPTAHAVISDIVGISCSPPLFPVSVFSLGPVRIFPSFQFHLKVSLTYCAQGWLGLESCFGSVKQGHSKDKILVRAYVSPSHTLHQNML